MGFIRYSSIENSYRKLFLEKVIRQGHGDLEYVVQEKIHGSNFSFWIDEVGVKCAKRSSFINEDEKFFNFRDVRDKYKARMTMLFKELQKSGASSVIVYGELYGGVYPHKDVEKFNQSAVQKGIYYNPSQDFIAFDIKVDGIDKSVNFVNRVLKEFDIPYVETLFTGKLNQCLEFNNKYPTTIPKKLGFPEIKDNICEGNVIRPVNTVYLDNGERVILKNKNEIFSERSKMKKNKFKQHNPILDLSEDCQKAIEMASQYVTENRLRNVLSKIGEVKQNDFGKILKLFSKDIIDDFTKDEILLFNELNKKEQRAIFKNISKLAAKTMGSNMLNIIDGNF